jgi:hypothetical protein
MALKVKTEKIKPEGKILLFLFFFVMLLIIFTLFLFLLLLIGGYMISRDYITYYIEFSPLTVVLPLVIAITTVRSYKTSLIRISPASNVNIPRLKELFFSKEGYRVIEEREGYVKFERSKRLPRILWLNIDKPYIEVKNDEVLIKVEKQTEAILTPLLVYGKKYDLSAES